MTVPRALLTTLFVPALLAGALAQAQDPSVPLLERLRFLCISCTNLDEFFEIRGGSVRHAIEFGLPAAADGLAPTVLITSPAATQSPTSFSSDSLCAYRLM